MRVELILAKKLEILGLIIGQIPVGTHMLIEINDSNVKIGDTHISGGTNFSGENHIYGGKISGNTLIQNEPTPLESIKSSISKYIKEIIIGTFASIVGGIILYIMLEYFH
jgi:hypothetical protein